MLGTFDYPGSGSLQFSKEHNLAVQNDQSSQAILAYIKHP